MIRYFDRDGKPLDSGLWSLKLTDEAYQRVALDDVGGVTVSTVWLGLDHQFRPGGPPLIFETMGFGVAGADDIQRRYSTEAEALAGHREIVARLRKNAELAGG